MNYFKNIIIAWSFTLLFFSCKQKAVKQGTQENIIREPVTSIIINNSGDTIGKLKYIDSSNLYFSPFSDTSKRVFLNKNGVSKIGNYYYNLPHNNILVFDEFSIPSKVEWYNLGRQYSEVRNIKSDIGNVPPTSSQYIDTSLISLPHVFITKGNKGKYKLNVYSHTYPIYLMYYQSNIYGTKEVEYNFMENSFTLIFNKSQINSDTLKITFNYLEDFVDPKDRVIIKTLHHSLVINDSNGQK